MSDALVPQAPSDRKSAGAYFTPEPVARTLVRWAVRHDGDTVLDPSCGDGRFISLHGNSTGIEREGASACSARRRAPDATVVEADFFTWVAENERRFDCAVGNPPFIRYQRFNGATRRAALACCRGHGVRFAALASSWAPFLVAAAGSLKPGGRMAFVVPAEIGHAPYARPLLDFLVGSFDLVRIVALREKMFPDLSEDCWLLFADGYGGATSSIELVRAERFSRFAAGRAAIRRVGVRECRANHGGRLRPYLLSDGSLDSYAHFSQKPSAPRLGDLGRVGIGYVSGANGFFHLRPSTAERLGIPREFLVPSVRGGRYLTDRPVTPDAVRRWLERDDPVLLLRIPPEARVPAVVRRYLDTDAAHRARAAFKCRSRTPWYSVPDVRKPDFFLTYMNGRTPALAENAAGCTCTNALLAFEFRENLSGRARTAARRTVLSGWASALGRLSCELEGHPLGGGLLKLEPGEARRVLLLPDDGIEPETRRALLDGVETMRRWRHIDAP